MTRGPHIFHSNHSYCFATSSLNMDGVLLAWPSAGLYATAGITLFSKDTKKSCWQRLICCHQSPPIGSGANRCVAVDVVSLLLWDDSLPHRHAVLLNLDLPCVSRTPFCWRCARLQVWPWQPTNEPNFQTQRLTAHSLSAVLPIKWVKCEIDTGNYFAQQKS